MRIKIISTCYGTSDGVRVHRYVQGETLDVPEILALQFIASGHAVPITPNSDEGL